LAPPEVVKAPRWAWRALLVILIFDVWLRGHTFGPTVRERFGVRLWPVVAGGAEPLDCDEAAYAYIGRRIVRGDVLYRDLTENKPPGGYWLYTLAVALGGADELTVRLMPIPLVLATIALIWGIGLRLAGPGAGCLAALTYAVASTDPYLYGNGANLEHAINLCSVASLALLIRGWSHPGRGAILAAGACLGAACLVKQVAIAHLPLYAVALWVREPASGPDRSKAARGLDLAALAGGFAVVWGIAILVLVLRGAGPAAFDDIVRYGGALATDTPAERRAPPFFARWITGNADPRTGALPWPFGRTDWLVWWGTGTWPLWVAAIPGVAWLLLGRYDGRRRLLAGWTLSGWVQVALPGLFWAHYYLLPLPGVALVVAVLGADAVRAFRSAVAAGRPPIGSLWGSTAVLTVAAGSWTASLLVSAALGWTAVIQVRDYLLVAPEQLTIRYKGGGQWVTLRALGRDLARRATIWPDPRLYVWGWQSPLHIYAGLDGVSPHFFADPLLKAFAGRNHPLIRPRTERILRDLHARPPELIFAGDPPFPELRAFLLERYLPSHLVPMTPDGRGLWVERRQYARFEEEPDPPRRREKMTTTKDTKSTNKNSNYFVSFVVPTLRLSGGLSPVNRPPMPWDDRTR
jgi:4-amino-4-deoxy-L-arabinose transferase-like glycosyltransferase